MKNEEIIISRYWRNKVSTRYKNVFSFLFAMFFFTCINAQTKNVFNHNKNSDGIEKKYLKSCTISGTIADSITNEAIPYVKVLLRIDNEIMGFAFCDFDGRYLIQLKDSINNNVLASIEFLQTGFDTAQTRSLIVNSMSINIDTIFVKKSFLALSEIKIIRNYPTPKVGSMFSCNAFHDCTTCYSPNRIAGIGINEAIKLIKPIDSSPRPSRLDLSGEGYIIK